MTGTGSYVVMASAARSGEMPIGSEGMRVGSVIDVPVVHDGAGPGTMNLLDVEHHDAADHVAPWVALAPLLIPADLEARRNG